MLARSDYTVRRQAAWAIGRGGRAAATVTQELTAGSARRLSEDAIAIYRRKRGLLSADQIRSIRESYTLTQAEFGRLLRLGSNSLSRWESGRNVQTEAMDTLLRLIRDVPGSIDYLRSHAA